MTTNDIKQINWKQPKFLWPLVLYPLLLLTAYLFIDLFHTEVANVNDQGLEETEYLNSNLPQAHMRGDGIGSRRENMERSFGEIHDYTAVENIDRDGSRQTEDYESKYLDEDLALLEKEAAAKTEELLRMQKQQNDGADGDYPYLDDTANAEALADLEKALAEARLKGRQIVENTKESVDTVKAIVTDVQKTVKTEVNQAVTAIAENAEAQEVVKSRRPSSSYFNTISENAPEPRLIKAIIDEDVKAVDGSRVRLRLLDDIEIGGETLSEGSYLYATMSGFGQQRVKGNVKSMMIADRIIKVNLSIYDTDGMEGLYVPNSSFRETAKDVAGGALDQSMTINNGTTDNSFNQWGIQAIQNAYQQTSNAISKAIKKNRVNLKYGTFVYLVNGREVKEK